MYFEKSFFELIKIRKSDRSYTNEKISQEELEKIMEDINKFKGVFKDSVRFELIVDDRDLNPGGEKLGTYGFIKGAKYYLAAIVNRDQQSLYELGYRMEKAILYLTAKNLGTCWIGGTFTRGRFAEKISLVGDEYLPIVVPFGYTQDKQSIKDKMIRLGAGSNKRKPWEELFFNQTLDSPLSKEMAGDYELALEAVRIAPSASNKQPWRIVQNKEDFELFLKPTPKYSDKTGFKIQEVDIGIAMAHFEMVALEEGNKGQWQIELGQTEENASHMIHVATWKTN